MKIYILALAIANLATCLMYGDEYIEQSGRTLHLHMLAQYKTAGGSLDDASHYYEQLISNTNLPGIAFKGYTQFLALNNRHQEIVRCSAKLDELFPDDPTVQLAIIDALDKTGAHIQAVERLMRVSQKNQTDQEITFKAAQVYIAQRELENAIKVIDAFLENAAPKPNQFLFHFLKAQILIQLNKKKGSP